MTSATLTIDHTALAANWLALNAASDGKAAAVVKANGYGLGAAEAPAQHGDAWRLAGIDQELVGLAYVFVGHFRVLDDRQHQLAGRRAIVRNLPGEQVDCQHDISLRRQPLRQ